MKVLLVDSDAKAARSLARGLRQSGFVVDLAEDVRTALYLAGTTSLDLIVTEVAFPDSSGWELVRQLRESGNQTPVFFVSRAGTVKDRVKGLELGADDYLAKPFSFEELLARARSILRRAPQRQPAAMRVGELEIDLLRRSVLRAGRRIVLTRKEFELLLALARRPGEVVPKARLMKEVWDINYRAESNTLAVQMRRLRLKIDGPGLRKLILVEHGVGYRLADP